MAVNYVVDQHQQSVPRCYDILLCTMGKKWKKLWRKKIILQNMLIIYLLLLYLFEIQQTLNLKKAQDPSAASEEPPQRNLQSQPKTRRRRSDYVRWARDCFL